MYSYLSPSFKNIRPRLTYSSSITNQIIPACSSTTIAKKPTNTNTQPKTNTKANTNTQSSTNTSTNINTPTNTNKQTNTNTLINTDTSNMKDTQSTKPTNTCTTYLPPSGTSVTYTKDGIPIYKPTLNLTNRRRERVASTIYCPDSDSDDDEMQ